MYADIVRGISRVPLRGLRPHPLAAEIFVCLDRVGLYFVSGTAFNTVEARRQVFSAFRGRGNPLISGLFPSGNGLGKIELGRVVGSSFYWCLALILGVEIYVIKNEGLKFVLLVLKLNVCL